MEAVQHRDKGVPKTLRQAAASVEEMRYKSVRGHLQYRARNKELVLLQFATSSRLGDHLNPLQHSKRFST